MRLPVNRILPLAALVLIGTSAANASQQPHREPAPVTGPAADYPLVVGEPFTIGQTIWTPVDQLNYDAVGYASVGASGLTGVTGAHKTLPLPCYVEVTSLATGKTILVRLERRGPMVNDVLVELAPMAAEQLGIVSGARAAVRVRRVNPPEPERATLRGGARASERMETPEGLLKVLRRKLADQAPMVPPPSTPPTMSAGLPSVPVSTATADRPAPARPAAIKPAAAKPTAAKPTAAKPTAAKPTAAKPAPAATAKAPLQPAKTDVAKPESTAAATPAAQGAFVVQAGAFSIEANATKLARQLGATVSRAGKLWVVRSGPFANRAQAEPALEKARRAGYKDARIQPAD